MDLIFAFLQKIALLEIATLRDNPECRPAQGHVYQASFKNAYEKKLEESFKFKTIDWTEKPFSSFKILKENPPGKLHVENGHLLFKKDWIVVNDWSSFIDSFRQVRNNVFHGAKMFKSGNLALEDRDYELVSAALAFISLLEQKGLVCELVY